MSSLRRGVPILAATLVFGVLSVPRVAAEVVVTWVEKKQQPLQGRGAQAAYSDESMAKALEQTRKALGEEAAAQMKAALEQVKELPAQIDQNYSFYPFGIENRDQVRRVDRIEVLFEFLDDRGDKLGERAVSYDLELASNQDDRLTVVCESAACFDSSSVAITIQSADYTELDYGADNEIAFGWNDRRWFLEDGWQQSRTLTLRTFSASYYGDQGYDEKVFAAGKLEHDDGRYYRLRKQDLPAGYPDDRIAYEFEEGGTGFAYAYGLLPGFVVEQGARTKPGFLDGEISNLDVKGTIEPGELVQIRAVEADKKSLMLIVSPVCQLRSGHRALRSRIRFVLGKEVMKRPDHAAIDRAVRQLLEPVPIGEVAERCGPKSGSLVKRWTEETTVAQIENEWGSPDARAETADGEVLVYGTIVLHFREGHLDGFERRESR